MRRYFPRTQITAAYKAIMRDAVIADRHRASEASAGWVMVPRYPTEKMMEAPAEARPGFSTNVAYEIYRAMLAASPTLGSEGETRHEALLSIAQRLALAANEGDDQAQGTHYIDKHGLIRCKGSFLALIEDARAVTATSRVL